MRSVHVSPNFKLTPTRASPLPRPGPDCHIARSPTSTARRSCSPPTSLVPFEPPLAVLPSPDVPTSVRRSCYFHESLLTGAHAGDDSCNVGDSSTPAPRQPALSQGETRVSQVPGPSSSCVPWSKTPPGVTAPRPLSVRSPSSSGEVKPWTPGKTNHFVATGLSSGIMRLVHEPPVPFGHVGGRILRHRLRPLHGVRSAYLLASGEPSSLFTPRRHRTFTVRLLHLCM